MIDLSRQHPFAALMRIATLFAILFMPSAVRAGEPVDNDYFERKVRPILVTHCVACHGEQKQKGELRLDSRAGFAAGGQSGALVKPGSPDDSLFVRVIRYDGDIRMPQKGKLPDADVATLTEWVKGGAPWPEDPPAAKKPGESFDLQARARAHWSFHPITRPAPPETPDTKHQIRNEIDRFLLARLIEKGLTFAPEADKRVLLRRVYFDLIGLPPTPEEIAQFLRDDSPEAFEKVVDRLLASPHYGERWGRHWLDLVRYAETQGHEFDYDIADAWRYRDYVVRAFNSDLPFNQFLIEHVAGDLLTNPRRNPGDGANESLTATGFWWLGEAKHSPVDSRAEYADRIDNQIDVFGKAVLGLTVACARCHDHKFDAISTKDYYSLFSVLSSSRFNRADIEDPIATVKLLDELKRFREEPPKPSAIPESDWRAKATAFETFGGGWRSRWDACGLAFRPEAGAGFPHSGREVRKLEGSLRSPTFTIDKRYLAIRVAGRDGQARVILNGLQLIKEPIYGGLAKPVHHGEELRWIGFDLAMWKGQPAYLELLDDGPGYIAIREAWFADAPPPTEPVERVLLPESIPDVESKIPTPRRAPSIRDGTGIDERVFLRGNPKILGIEAPRGFLEAFGKPRFASTGSGRLELAQRLTDPANPLVARVIVNRLWKHHFGDGIVRSPDDFGLQGLPPTHPELLDWLASEFVQTWSLKRVHRLMVLSAAYRQSSRATPEQAARAVTADPQNRLLYRQNVRRLEAEAIRDAMLVVSGRLDRTVGGPSVLPHLSDNQEGRGRPASGPLDGNGRRSLYLAVRRNFLNPMFTAFDYPTPFTTIGKRTVSNVPAQALVMLNNPFVLQQAERWAKQLLSAVDQSPEERIGRMYQTAFGRAPSKDELAAAVEFVGDLAKEYGRPDDPRTWAALAHVLFNAKEFIFVE